MTNGIEIVRAADGITVDMIFHCCPHIETINAANATNAHMCAAIHRGLSHQDEVLARERARELARAAK